MRNNKESVKISSMLEFHLHGGNTELCLRIIKPQQKDQIITEIKRQNPVNTFHFISLGFPFRQYLLRGQKSVDLEVSLVFRALSARLRFWIHGCRAPHQQRKKQSHADQA